MGIEQGHTAASDARAEFPASTRLRCEKGLARGQNPTVALALAGNVLSVLATSINLSAKTSRSKDFRDRRIYQNKELA